MFWIIQFQFMGHLDAHRFKLWSKSVIYGYPMCIPTTTARLSFIFFRRISKIFMDN